MKILKYIFYLILPVLFISFLFGIIIGLFSGVFQKIIAFISVIILTIFSVNYLCWLEEKNKL